MTGYLGTAGTLHLFHFNGLVHIVPAPPRISHRLLYMLGHINGREHSCVAAAASRLHAVALDGERGVGLWLGAVPVRRQDRVLFHCVHV